MSADITTQDFFNNQQSFFDQFQAGEPESGAESGKRKDNGQLSGWSNNKSLKLPPKKPGRKLDTTIPPTKRKAQNRAAQRAFRERKEKHVKDLEDRVTELENEAAATNHENEFLKHQVERLQAELDKYKSANTSPRTSASTSSTSGGDNKAFTFEFPFFGDQHNHKSQAYPSPNSLPTTHATSESSSPFSTYKNTVSPFSSNSNDTPASSKGGDEEETFCDRLSLACGSTDNPVPRAPSLSSDHHKNSSSSSASSSSNNNNNNNNSEVNKDNDGLTSLFSPPPFDFDFLGSYRDPLFENTSAEFNLPELSTTEYSVFDPLENPIVDSSFGQLMNNEPVVKQEPQDDEPQQTKDDEVPAPKSKFMSCSAVWDRVSSHPKFNDLDIDGLCSELQTKVKCSDSGILLTENDVEKVLSTLS
jgi:AP-1-like factor